MPLLSWVLFLVLLRFGSGLKYRNVRAGDVKSVSELCAETFEGPFEWHQVLKRQKCEREYEAQFGERLIRMVDAGLKHGMLMAETNTGGPVAFVELGMLPCPVVEKADINGVEMEMRPDVMFLGNLAVKSDHRRQGIASKLLRVAEKLAEKWSERAIYVAVEAGNAPALQMYSKLGFEAILDERTLINARSRGSEYRIFLRKALAEAETETEA
jgi:ribosomal protein S18 acetylase RimI-like enzyme